MSLSSYGNVLVAWQRVQRLHCLQHFFNIFFGNLDFFKTICKSRLHRKLFLNLTHDTHTNKFGADIELSNAKDHGVYMCWLNVYVAVWLWSPADTAVIHATEFGAA